MKCVAEVLSMMCIATMLHGSPKDQGDANLPQLIALPTQLRASYEMMLRELQL